MFSNEVYTAMQRIKELQRLEASVASGELEISNPGRAALVYRVSAAKGALRGKLARDYLETLNRVRYLANLLNDLSFYGLKRDLNFVGEVIRRLKDARETLAFAAKAIQATTKAGVI